VCALVVGAMALSESSAAASSAGHKLVAYVNQIRAKYGRSPLRESGSLRRSSRRYAAWMLRHDYFGHRSTISASHSFRRVGETLAEHSGWSSGWRWVVRAWMHSSEHRRILLSSSFNWIGVGRARGRMGSSRATTWVAHVGAK
jgi:uncharacterized protein YkwD